MKHDSVTLANEVEAERIHVLFGPMYWRTRVVYFSTLFPWYSNLEAHVEMATGPMPIPDKGEQALFTLPPCCNKIGCKVYKYDCLTGISTQWKENAKKSHREDVSYFKPSCLVKAPEWWVEEAVNIQHAFLFLFDLTANFIFSCLSTIGLTVL